GACLATGAVFCEDNNIDFTHRRLGLPCTPHIALLAAYCALPASGRQLQPAAKRRTWAARQPMQPWAPARTPRSAPRPTPPRPTTTATRPIPPPSRATRCRGAPIRPAPALCPCTTHPSTTSAGNRCCRAPSSRQNPYPRGYELGTRSAGGDRDAEAGAAKLRRAVNHQLAVVGVNDVLHDRQANAVALHAFVTAYAALQHLLQLVGGNPRAVVLDAQVQGSRLVADRGLGLHRQQDAVPGPLERVVQQVAHQLEQVALLAVEHRTVLDVEFTQGVFRRVYLLQAAHQVFGMPGDRHRAGESLASRRGRPRQLVGHQLIH